MIATLYLFAAVLAASLQTLPTPERADGDVVCAPAVYAAPPEDCLPLGPSATYARLAASGIDLTQDPLPAYRPDPSLNNIPYLYFKVDPGGVAVYPSLEAAAARQGASRYIAPGFLYVSYLQRAETEQGVFYMLPSGEWIEGAGSRVSPPVFQGLLFARTPRQAFGWIISETNTFQAPNYNFNNPRVRTLYRQTQIIIYAQHSEGNAKWYLIGPDEWVEARFVAAVFPNPTPPAGVTNNRWIEVNLEQQTLAVYDEGQMRFATLISSGVEKFWTQPGLFQIYQKKDAETMSGAFEADRSDFYYLQNVPWTMYYDQARALHGAYWQTLLGYQRSHGCVNLSIGDSRWLYDWAREGDWVWVHDPSGRTPTDPSLYGSGGF
ncbi:MAG: L,D-transpeptidase [Anaerolineales bacterium]